MRGRSRIGLTFQPCRLPAFRNIAVMFDQSALARHQPLTGLQRRHQAQGFRSVGCNADLGETAP